MQSSDGSVEGFFKLVTQTVGVPNIIGSLSRSLSLILVSIVCIL